jgi:CubicO group peptidase (beta-lactamase class C family)
VKKILPLFGISAILPASLFLLMTSLSASGCSRENSKAESRDFALRSEAGSQKAPDSIRTELEDYLAAAEKEWGFQGSVLVARGEEVILKMGTGTADRVESTPNTPVTKFMIASVTKVFTAAAVMKLAEEALIRLDDPAVRYLQDFKDSLSGDITIRHLLSHSSGLPEFVPGESARGKMGESVGPRDLAAGIRGKEPLFRPGQEARYSNIGYILLGLIIEEVTGESYYDWIGGHILKPLGMNDSGTSLDYFSRPDFARGYVEDGAGNIIPAPFIHPSWGYSAGALYSTVEDLYRWDRALASTDFLAADFLEVMFRPHNPSFSLGWLVDSAFGLRSLAHGGGAPGYGAWIERWPEEDLFTAVLSNVTGMPVGEIGRSLAAVVFGESYEQPVKRTALAVNPDVLEEFLGGYLIKNGDIRHIIREGGSLYVIRGSGPRIPILPFQRDLFFFPNDKGAFIRFVRDDKGRLTGHIFHQLGLDEPASKIMH